MPESQIRLTLIGGPTLLLEIGGLRFLTDPTFDSAGGDYDIGLAILHKTESPTLSAEALGGVDVVLLSHDQHADNLDMAGRGLLPTAGAVLTTTSGATRLALPNAAGLERWQSREFSGTQSNGSPPRVRVTGVPGRHGPEGSEAMLGDVTGFVLEWEDCVLYLSGDTVWYEGIAEIACRFPRIDAAVLFLGGVRPADDGPLLTMDGAEAVLAVQALMPQTVIPVHYEGWQHYREGRASVEQAFAEAGLSERLVWLRPGEPQTVAI